MALHFSAEEFADRQKRAIAQMVERELGGLLMFRQESMYYLTGYDSFGYVFFQCLYLGADGRMMLLTRSPDLRQARHTSVIEDIRVWVDGPEVNPARALREILAEFGCKGQPLGVEYDAYGLTARNGRLLDSALSGFCTLTDASDLVNRLRMIKSPAELVYVRKAAELADRALDEVHRLAGPGADEGEILAAMQGAIFAGGGDYPGNEFIIGSGHDALLCRYKSGRRKLDAEDQLTLEWAGVYRHYHAALMRTIPIGRVTRRHQEMHQVAVEAMQACTAALKPDHPIGEVFDAYAKTCDAAGMRAHRLNATGYSLGATFAPNWMDWPMFYRGNPVPTQPNMVCFLHMILMDSESGIAMCPGHTVVVTGTGCETLSAYPLDLVVK
ncbi:MAG: aminopeptidase P family protein [Deltaproteobacteria bacterium]|nr:MAG: aminopeptidase P family protein [Deltaproteobacteria bacterium]